MIGGKGRLGVLAAFAMALLSGTAYAQSLQDEVGFLLRNHPQLKGLRNQVSASEEGINKAYGAYLPTVTFNGDYGYENTDSPARRAATPDAENFSTARTKATVTAVETLWDGGARGANYETSKLQKRSSEITLDNTTQNVIFEGVTAYLDVLRNKGLVDLAASNEEVIKTQLNLENERVQRGSGMALDVLQSKARLQIARERRVAFEGELANAMTRYTQVFGHPPDIATLAVPEVDPTLMPVTVDDAIAVALAEHPEIENSETLINLAQEQRKGAKSAYFPTLDVVGKYNYEDNVDGVDSIRRDYSVVLRANWELFSGFATRAAVAESAYQYAASVDNRNFVNQKIVEDVRLSWENLQTAQRRQSLLENAVIIASEVHSSRGKLREAGKDTVLNVLDAQNEVFDAQINELGAEYDTRLAAYRLILSMGRLDPDHLVPGVMPAASMNDGTDAAASDTAYVDEPVTEPTSGESVAAETVAVAEPEASVQEAEPAATAIVEPAATTVVVPEATETEAAAEPETIQWSTTALATSSTTAEPAAATVQPAVATTTASAEYVASPDPFDPNFSRSWSFDQGSTEP